jgi:hypothetical protein
MLRNAEKNTYDIDNKKHSSIRTYYITDFKDAPEVVDTMSGFLYDSPVFRLKTRMGKENFGMSISPVYETFYGININEISEGAFFFNGGVLADVTLSDKLGLSYIFSFRLFDKLPDFFITQNYNNTILNGYDQISEKNNYFSQNNDFKLTYLPFDFLKLEIANSKNFFGDGYRSLLLSDNAKNYPYFKIETQFLDIKYSCIWAYLSYFTYDEVQHITYKKNNKLAVFHYLDWNVTKRFSIGLFESVVASGKNFFDFEFLNPFIFFRPVDYSMGSSTNVIIGTNLKYSINSKNAFYLQVVIDDIVVKQLFNDLKHTFRKEYAGEYGWFANKWAVQFGEKSFDIGGIKNLDGFIEFNVARPYIYTQFDPNNNYAHYRQALAHPLGANFVEIVCGTNYYFKDMFNIDLKLMFATLGMDASDRTHNGQNIFLPTMDGVQPGWLYQVPSYGNVILQGNKTNVFTTQLDFSYFISGNRNLTINCGAIIRCLNPENGIIPNENDLDYNLGAKKLYTYFYIGFRSNLKKLDMLH